MPAPMTTTFAEVGTLVVLMGVIYQQSMSGVSTTNDSAASLAERAYHAIRTMIVQLELAPGDVVREADLVDALNMSRTPIREALQRLARDQFVTVIPRRGMLVSTIDVDELTLLYETRSILEPYAARLATQRGSLTDWDEMAAVLTATDDGDHSGTELIEIDRRCHEIIWRAAGNRFLTATLDTLYAQSDRLWHMYLSDVDDMGDAVDEHRAILDALVTADAPRAAELVEAHVKSFDAQVRAAVAARLGEPSG